MNVAEFKAAVKKARAKNPACVYCGANLKRAPLAKVMFMRGSKRIACANCPGAMVVMTVPSEKQPARRADRQP